MKFVSFINQGNQTRLGLYFQNKYFDLEKMGKNLNLTLPSSMQSFLEEAENNLLLAQKVQNFLKESHDSCPEENIKQLLSPVPQPTSCRDGYAFRQHVQTMRANRGAPMAPEFDQFPVFYFTNHNAIIGEGDVHLQADHFHKMDFELELAIVIGKKGRNIKAEHADDYILGYTIMNDLSARHLQLEEMKMSLGPAKGKDFATSIGPWLVTKDELEAYKEKSPHGDRYNLNMSAYHNGKLISQGNSNTMNWTFAQIIERVSYGVDILPGDVIGSGTVGTGCYAEINGTAARKAKENNEDFKPTWLQANDTIELRIDGLGSLKNRLLEDQAPYSILDY